MNPMDQNAKILVLDDDEERHAWFLKRFFPERVLIVTTAADAIEKMGTAKFALIFLDHDLEYHHYGSDNRDDPNTGYAAARWLADRPRKQPFARVVVHSMNYLGGKRMVEALRSARVRVEHIPFNNLCKR